MKTFEFQGTKFTLAPPTTYWDGAPALQGITDEGPETLTTNMAGYGFPPALYIKNWSEHEGLADVLAEAGIVEIVQVHSVPGSPFDLTVTEVELVDWRWMTQERIDHLRKALESESISYGELAEIESSFNELDPTALRDLPENAMASDMLDELEEHLGTIPPTLS